MSLLNRNSSCDFTSFKVEFEKIPVAVYKSIALPRPLVSVCAVTYNHVDYIRQCLDGLLMQQTNFDFEILLGEDASTDGTREICMEYADRFPKKIRLFLHHRENNIKINGSPTGRFNMLYNLFSANGKYIALCEGDDYWTDPLKLQKQVDFLEADSNYIVCYHWQSLRYEKNAGVYYGETLGDNQMTFSSVRDLFEWKIRIEARTMLFKNIFKEVEIPDWFLKIAFGDIGLNFILGAYGKFGFINENMAVYRITGNGISLNGIKNTFKKKWTIDHQYKWLSIWLYANAHHNKEYRISAIKGYNSFLFDAIVNENFVAASLRQIAFIMRHEKDDFFILKYSLQFIFKHFVSKSIRKLKKLIKGLIRKSG